MKVSNYYLAVACFFIALSAKAQLKHSVQEMSAVPNPALSIMGAENDNISTPKTWSKFQASLVSSFLDQNSLIIPDDFGVEVMPYWFKSRPEDHYKVETIDRATFQGILKTTAVSLATINKNIGDTNQQTQFGAGVRFQVYNGHLNDKQVDALKSAEEKVGAYAKGFKSAKFQAEIYLDSKLKNQSYLEFKSSFSSTPVGLTEPQKFQLEEVMDHYAKVESGKEGDDFPLDKQKIVLLGVIDWAESHVDEEKEKELLKQIEKLRMAKVGFFLEVAGASYLDLPQPNYSFSRIPKAGLWVTASYRFEPKLKSDSKEVERQFEVNFLGRAISDFLLAEEVWNYDFGIALNQRISRWSFQAEGIFRNQNITTNTGVDSEGFNTFQTRVKSDYKLSAIVSYKVNEHLEVYYTGGRDFIFTESSNQEIVNQLALRFNIGEIGVSESK